MLKQTCSPAVAFCILPTEEVVAEVDKDDYNLPGAETLKLPKKSTLQFSSDNVSLLSNLLMDDLQLAGSRYSAQLVISELG